MTDLFSVLGLFLLFYIQGGQCYETCYNYYYAEYYECEHGCCGDWDDVDYGCCTLTGQIVGGVIGGLILIGIIVFLVVFCCVLKKKGGVGSVFSTNRNRNRNVAPASNVTVIHHPGQPQHQPYGNQGMQMGQTYPGPPPQQYPGPPQQQYPGAPQGPPPGYGMMPPPQQQQYPPPPPPQYDPAYPPKY